MKRKILFYLFILSLSANGQTAMLTCTAGGYFNSNFLIESVLQDEGACNSVTKKINVAILDSCSFIPWTTDSCTYGYFDQQTYYDCFGNSTCFGHPQPYKYFQFECFDSVQMNGLLTLLNSVPTGHHILAFTFASFIIPVCNWPSSVRNAFIQMGSNMFSTIADTLPFIFYIKKGFPGTMQEITGTHAGDTVSLTVTIECLPAFVNENEINNSHLTLFPNPATSELRIENAELRIKEIEIYNTLGEKCLTPTLPRNTGQVSKGEGVRVDVSLLPAGVYFVAVTDDKGNKITRRFIKM